MFECGNKAHAYMDAGLVEDVDTVNQVGPRITLVCVCVCVSVSVSE